MEGYDMLLVMIEKKITAMLNLAHGTWAHGTQTNQEYSSTNDDRGHAL